MVGTFDDCAVPPTGPAIRPTLMTNQGRTPAEKYNLSIPEVNEIPLTGTDGGNDLGHLRHARKVVVMVTQNKEHRARSHRLCEFAQPHLKLTRVGDITGQNKSLGFGQTELRQKTPATEIAGLIQMQIADPAEFGEPLPSCFYASTRARLIRILLHPPHFLVVQTGQCFHDVRQNTRQCCSNPGRQPGVLAGSNCPLGEVAPQKKAANI